jgi:hypothetical protein
MTSFSYIIDVVFSAFIAYSVHRQIQNDPIYQLGQIYLWAPDVTL